MSGNPAAVAAGLATLNILKAHPEVYKAIDQKGAMLEAAYVKAAKDHCVEACVNRVGSLLSVFFTKGPVETYKDVTKSNLSMFRQYFASMMESGIYIAPSQFESMFVEPPMAMRI